MVSPTSAFVLRITSSKRGLGATAPSGRRVRGGVATSCRLDGESVSEYTVKLAEFTEQFGELTDEDKGKTKPVASQQHARKADDDGVTGGVYEGMEFNKEDADCAKIGAEMAAWANQQNGLVPAK